MINIFAIGFCLWTLVRFASLRSEFSISFLLGLHGKKPHQVSHLEPREEIVPDSDLIETKQITVLCVDQSSPFR